jgi:undecaprenyl pyrophosphate phosphatase UppP
MWKLSEPKKDIESDSSSKDNWEKQLKKLRRIDFLGAITTIATTLTFLLGLEFGSKEAWNSPSTIGLLVCSLAFGILFIAIEKYWAREPIFPVRLMLHRDILTNYLITLFQGIAQMGVSHSDLELKWYD